MPETAQNHLITKSSVIKSCKMTCTVSFMVVGTRFSLRASLFAISKRCPHREHPSDDTTWHHDDVCSRNLHEQSSALLELKHYCFLLNPCAMTFVPSETSNRDQPNIWYRKYLPGVCPWCEHHRWIRYFCNAWHGLYVTCRVQRPPCSDWQRQQQRRNLVLLLPSEVSVSPWVFIWILN